MTESPIHIGKQLSDSSFIILLDHAKKLPVTLPFHFNPYILHPVLSTLSFPNHFKLQKGTP